MTDITAVPAPVRKTLLSDRKIRLLARRGDRTGDHLPPLDDRFRPDDFAPPRVNLRWLIGAILTAFAGASLIGSAIIYSLERNTGGIVKPDILPLTKLGDNALSGTTLSKGDRLVANELISARQSFKAPTPVKMGDQEIIKLQPYVRVSTNLVLAPIGYANDVPNFDPLKIFAGADNAEIPKLEIRAADNDPDVSLKRRALNSVSFATNSTLSLSDAQIESQVEEARQAAINLGRAMPTTFGDQQFLTRTLPLASGSSTTESIDTAFSNIQISVVPENVTDIAKKPPKPTVVQSTSDERIVNLKRSNQIDRILMANRVARPIATEAAKIIYQQIKDTPIKDGQKLRILLSVPPNPKSEPRLLRVMLYDADQITAITAINDQGVFVAVAPPSSEGIVGAEEQPDEAPVETNKFTLYNSLYETALKNDIPKPIIEQLIRIYFYDVDLQRKVTGGDSFEVFYAEDEERADRFEVLYAALSVSGITKRYYRYRAPDDNSLDYFDEQGKSNRRFLMRKPITEGIFRSGFGMRYHPILKVERLHSGVDWANAVGTPILAAGDGVVTWADWDTGYGRHIEIQHAYDFVTTYSHLSAFARGITGGVRVRQGQVIGYLGSSGLSTGPHLHYEVLVKGEFKDPMAIKLPRNKELNNSETALFKQQQDIINDIMSKAPGAVRVANKSAQP
ncbi:MAG: M23 family metallopeptidase [Alphaproteobacteria bacterium]|nr:M23 family metallopeptidase [Alphaproteobacteria bacterium]